MELNKEIEKALVKINFVEKYGRGRGRFSVSLEFCIISKKSVVATHFICYNLCEINHKDRRGQLMNRAETKNRPLSLQNSCKVYLKNFKKHL